MEKGCGSKFMNAIAKRFCGTVYYPKVTNTLLGEGINSPNGVTQGNKTSSNLFSFYLSDMSTAFDESHGYDDFTQPCNFGQLADDTVVYAEHRESLRHKCEQLMNYLKKKYQVLNIKKTKYCEFSSRPSFDDLLLDNGMSISSVNMKDGYVYGKSSLSPSQICLNDFPSLMFDLP